MSRLSIDQLPPELIVRIAIYCDAVSVLDLSATCRHLHASCRDSAVFRQVIVRSQYENWCDSTFDVDAIGQRCGDDVSSWARYAVADQRAYTLLKEPAQAVDLSSTLPWSPALFVAKHPFVHGACWTTFEALTRSADARQMWCVAAATLACGRSWAYWEQDIGEALDASVRTGDESLHNSLQGLCWTILDIRASMERGRMRRDAFSPLSTVPYVKLPGMLDLLRDRRCDSLPLPFSNNTADWDVWNIEHSESLLDSLLSGVWQGYCTYPQFMARRYNRLDPAMTNIRFRRLTSDSADGQIPIIARNCRNEVGKFKIQGTLSRCDSGVTTFTGSKVYYIGEDPTSERFRWAWSLKLTSFGLVGYWGTMKAEKLDRSGQVWLWMKS